MRRENRRRRLPLLAPLLERGERVEYVRSVATAAVRHAWREEQADRLIHLLLADRPDNIVVVVNRRLGCDVLVGPSLVNQELAAAGDEWLEVGRGRTQIQVVDLVYRVVVAREIERAEVPLRILEDDELEEISAHRERFRTARRAAPAQLAAGLEARKDSFARLGIRYARIELASGLHLWRREAVRRVAGFALR